MLTHYLIRNGIILEPSTKRKWNALEHMTSYFCSEFPGSVFDNILETILSRELIVSTGLGGGVAIPHARTNMISRTGLLFARFREGIDWGAIDDAPVYFVFMIIGPQTSAEEYLHVLSKISKMLSRKPNRMLLQKAKSPDEVIDIFNNIHDRKVTR